MSRLLPPCRSLLRCLPRPLLPITVPRRLSARSLQTLADSSAQPSPDFAFAFDISGVLLHGSRPHPKAAAAFQTLTEHNAEFVLISNSGGPDGSARAAELSTLLSTPIRPSQYIHSHTLIAELPPLYKTVLVLGGVGDTCRHAAQSYGFKNVITPADIFASDRHVCLASPSISTSHAQPLPSGEVKIDAVLVLDNPSDWALDLQILTDVIISDAGRLGTRRQPLDREPHIPLYFTNPDLITANEHPFPRLSQGMFRSALYGIMDQVRMTHGKTGSGVPRLFYNLLGKPDGRVFGAAESALPEGVKTIYMVGDNPVSDIKGANEWTSPRGVEWVTVLVESGVYRGEYLQSPLKPKIVAKDVSEAVIMAIGRDVFNKRRARENALKEQKIWSDMEIEALRQREKGGGDQENKQEEEKQDDGTPAA